MSWRASRWGTCSPSSSAFPWWPPSPVGRSPAENRRRTPARRSTSAGSSSAPAGCLGAPAAPGGPSSRLLRGRLLAEVDQLQDGAVGVLEAAEAGAGHPDRLRQEL